MRRRTLWAVGVGVVVSIALGTAGVNRWRDQRRAKIIAPQVQPAPDLAALAPEARARMTTRRLEATRGNLTALGELSRLYHANGFLAEAARCYEVLEQLVPTDPRWRHRHASILAGYGDAGPAIEQWRRVVALAPEYVPAQLRLGDVLLKTNRRDEAAGIFRDVLRRRPNDPHAVLGLARIDVEAERWTEARAKLEKIVAQTDYALGYDLIVTVYERLGMGREAAAVRSRTKASGAYRDIEDPWMSELLADCYDAYQLALAAGAAERAGSPETAVRWLERAIALAPDQVAPRFQLGGLYLRRREVKNAREQFERCTTIAPDFADGWAHLSALLEDAGDRAAAERAVASGLQHCPESPGLHLMRARQLRRNGNAPAAIAAYHRSIELRPNEAEPIVELAMMLLQQNRERDAEGWLQRAIAVEPDHPTALTVLALTAISSGDETTARRWLARVREQPRIAPAQVQELLGAYRAQFKREYR